ncbi:helix-turn-helix domain-containing protein [Staphylococcus massiliensis]|uniref:helix-turn-helix domain-containing protein n=1 Tax=Staphylococcus massiliensis TaxID=555791 RepID=UPI001EE0E34C|nr:helix-turn-helix transcriptional regulator [Staphylococcus massiliensis]MCG3402590.1 helix-turn-helix domain-containing protein [Staphylococcus massiliensis]
MSFNVLKYCKDLREEKEISVRKIAEKIGYSYSYISSMENKARNNPSDKFIKDYILGLVENNHSEFNYHSEKIKELSDGDIDLGIYVDSATSILDSATNKKVSSYITESHTHNGNYYDFSVNDLKYHLEDEKNTTYYGRVPLDAEDSQRIKLLIYNYLNTKYDILKSQLNALYNSKTINEDKYNKILDEIETIKRYIK